MISLKCIVIFIFNGVDVKKKIKQKQKKIQEELHKVSKKALRFVTGVHIHVRK